MKILKILPFLLAVFLLASPVFAVAGSSNANLTIIVNVVNDNGRNSTPADFVWKLRSIVNGTTLASNNGSSSGQTVSFTPPVSNASVTYWVELDPTTPADFSNYVYSMSSDCQGKAVAGDNKTCTITLDDIPSCEFTPKANRTIVDFNTQPLRAGWELSPVSVSLPAGHYDISLMALDAFSARANQSQPLEQYLVKLLTGGGLTFKSSPTSDLADNIAVASVSEKVDADVVFTKAVDQVVAKHAYSPPTNANTLSAVCAAFDFLGYNDPAPIISLNGANPINLVVGDTFTDPGVTVDYGTGGGSGSTTVVSGDVVDTTTAGTYVIIYTATNADGQSASVSRTVIVSAAPVVNQSPTITLLGANPINLVVGDTFTDPGATASDPEDGDLTSAIVVTGSVDTTTAGTYTLIYTVTDSGGTAAGATATVTRIVNVVSSPPNPGVGTVRVCKMILDKNGAVVDGTGLAGDFSVSFRNVAWAADQTETFDLPLSLDTAVTMKADDAECIDIPFLQSGNYTYSEEVISGSGTWEAPRYFEGGTLPSDVLNHSWTYGPAHNRSDGKFTLNSGSSMTLLVINQVGASSVNQTPSIVLSGNSTMNLTVGDTFTDPGATASDPEDGDLTSAIVVTGSVDTTTAGTYTVTYTVTDSDGASASASRTVVVGVAPVPNQDPTISLNGSATINLNTSDTFTDPGATASDPEDGDLTSSIVTTGTVDTTTAGTYTVTYTVTDSDGASASVSRTVVVKDGGGGGPTNMAPTITLLGSPVINIYVGDTFTDPGATASDPEDGDLTSVIVIAGDTVNTNTVGTYVITYDVTDSQGAAASQYSRTVNVAAKVSPPSGGGGGGGSVLQRVIINDGDDQTGSREVELTLIPQSASDEMMISNDENFDGAAWEPYLRTKSWTLSDESGVKTVYVKFRNHGNQLGYVVNDTIDLILGEVLGTETTAPTCGLYITEYMGYGMDNNAFEVTKLQQFLNDQGYGPIPVTGFFGEITLAAVNQFQLAEKEYILDPWIAYGLAPNTPTGYVYKTTMWRINTIMCPSAEIPMPLIP